ncbi:hypothetical protein R1sor_012746 [Riccia sorocarpa]|uniref:Uncharacterized protein n=1 Tax=Riccia sorocarpa TaxID=122646 RepID=A0ABD3I4N0_9MARC
MARFCTRCSMHGLLPKLAAIQFMDLIFGQLELEECDDFGELCRLKELQVLIIRSCEGTGNWATSLGELRRLKRLELVRIREPFELPVSFGGLTALQYLKIESCRVCSLPVSFTNLTNLRYLVIDEIVSKQAISFDSFPHLQVLQMRCWAIADLPRAFRGLTALKSLELHLEEPQAVPDVFGHLDNLRRLRLRCHGLENSLVESLGKLTNLEILRLESEDRTSELDITLDSESLRIEIQGQLAPPGILEPLVVYLSRVEVFDLVHKHGSIPDFGHLQNLRSIRVTCKGVEDSLLEGLGNMINLEHLGITIQGQQTVGDVFGGLPNLRTFMLVCNCVENSLVKSFKNMINLEELIITIRGQQTVRDIFGHLQKLRKFELDCSDIENSLVESLANMINLEDLSIQVKGEHLTTLPESLGQLAQLRKFSLSHYNHLTTLPESLGQLYQLRELSLSHCNHLITLPESLGQLYQLRKLSISDCNHLTTLPESLGQLSQLSDLSISDCNQLTTLPHTVGQLSSLLFLTVHNCRLVEALPDSIGQLLSLVCLDLKSPALHFLPESLKDLPQLQHLFNTSRCVNPSLAAVENVPQVEYTSCGPSGLGIFYVTGTGTHWKRIESSI